MAEEGKRRGRFLQYGKRESDLQFQLLGHYRNNPDFITDFKRVIGRHEQLLCSERERLFAAGSRVFERTPPIPDPTSEERFRPLLDDLKPLAYRWNLPCDWAVPALHESAILSFLFPSFSPFLVPGGLFALPSSLFVQRIKLDLPYDVRDDWGKWVQNTLMPEVIRLRDEAEEELWRAGLGRKYDTEPLLKRNIRWLYLRICPQQDIGRPWSFKMIAKEERFVGKRTVESTILKLARELHLTLPRLPSGPCRYQ